MKAITNGKANVIPRMCFSLVISTLYKNSKLWYTKTKLNAGLALRPEVIGSCYGKGLIYCRPIFQLTKLAFLRARTIPREKIF